MSLPSDRYEVLRQVGQEQQARDAALIEAERPASIALQELQEQQRYDASIRAVATECAKLHEHYRGRERATELREVAERLDFQLKEEEKRLFPENQPRDFEKDERFQQYCAEARVAVYHPQKYLEKGLEAERSSHEQPSATREDQAEPKQPDTPTRTRAQPELGPYAELKAAHREALEQVMPAEPSNAMDYANAWESTAKEVTARQRGDEPPSVPDFSRSGDAAPNPPEPNQASPARETDQLRADARPNDQLQPDTARLSLGVEDDRTTSNREITDRMASQQNEAAKPKSDRQARLEAADARARTEYANRARERGDDDGGRGMDR